MRTPNTILAHARSAAPARSAAHARSGALLLAAVLLAALLPRPADARCAGAARWVFPEPGTALPTEPRLAVTGYGQDQAWVRDLARHRPELVAGDDRVPVRVMALHEGDFRVTRAIVVPERPLVPGLTYVLEAEHDGRRLTLAGTRHGAAEGWPVIDATGPSPPRWTATPRVTDATWTRLGCGPVSHVHVSVGLAGGAGPVVVRATVRALGHPDAEPVTYELEVEDGEVRIGHSMCSGAFRLAPGARYEVTLEAVGQDGRPVPAPGGPLRVTGPGPG